MIFLFRSYAYNPLISVINNPVYNYYNRTGSVSKGLTTLNILQKRIDYIRQTAEYKKMPRHAQLWIDDNFVGIIFVGIANLQRHGISFLGEIDKIYNIYTTMFKYNQQELKSARNYQKLKSLFQQIGLNRPL